MIKRPDSKYVPNGRNKQGWVKLKPDYLEKGVTDLDLLIVGGYFGYVCCDS